MTRNKAEQAHLRWLREDVKKGGGRESGKPSGQSRVEESGGVPAAANPVCPCWKCTRIRELEASRREDVDRAGRFLARAEKAEARVAELEADPFRMTEAEWIAATNALAREREEC